MSGHSKWATIHRAKEAKDAKKGAVFTKMAFAISMAVKQGGGIGDPDKNFRLRLTVDKARAANMPKENIARAIEKGMGGAGGSEVAEVVYEGFLPGGVAVMAEALTDNKARTAQQVRSILDRNGGSLGGTGTVNYMFENVGEIVVDLAGKNEDEAELSAIDAGATDFSVDEGKMLVFCEKDQVLNAKDKLAAAGYTVESAEVIMKPENIMEIADVSVREKIESTIEELEELEDISKVWSNYGGSI